MGFPESYLLPPGLTSYEQLGNAVTPAVIALVAGKMLGDEKRGLRACMKLTAAGMEKEMRQVFVQTGRVVSQVFSGRVRELICEEEEEEEDVGFEGCNVVLGGHDGTFSRWASVATLACFVFAATCVFQRRSGRR